MRCSSQGTSWRVVSHLTWGSVVSTSFFSTDVIHIRKLNKFGYVFTILWKRKKVCEKSAAYICAPNATYVCMWFTYEIKNVIIGLKILKTYQPKYFRHIKKRLKRKVHEVSDTRAVRDSIYPENRNMPITWYNSSTVTFSFAKFDLMIPVCRLSHYFHNVIIPGFGKYKGLALYLSTCLILMECAGTDDLFFYQWIQENNIFCIHI